MIIRVLIMASTAYKILFAILFKFQKHNNTEIGDNEVEIEVYYQLIIIKV